MQFKQFRKTENIKNAEHSFCSEYASLTVPLITRKYKPTNRIIKVYLRLINVSNLGGEIRRPGRRTVGGKL